MKALVTAAVALFVTVPGFAGAAQTCPDRTPDVILAPAADSAKCLAAMAKAATGYVKKKMKTDGKCLGQQVAGVCPSAKDTEKTTKAGTKAAGKIVKACSPSQIAGLSSSYATGFGADDVGSCMLSQHNASTDLLLAISNGTPVQWPGSDNRLKCVQALGKAATSYVPAILKAVNSCVSDQIAAGNMANLAPVCVGSYAGGSFTPPSDADAQEAIQAAIADAEDTVNDECSSLAQLELDSIFACPDHTNAASLTQCIVCENWNGVLDLLEQQYAETGQFVANGLGNLQTAWDGAATGSKFLVESGDYMPASGDFTDDPVISITQTGLCSGGDDDGEVCSNDGDCGGGGTCVGASPTDVAFVGCGGATGERPRMLPDSDPIAHANGVFAANVDGLLFQSLEAENWEENGIFVTNAEGVTFRDVIGDGGTTLSRYAIFPVESDDVLVETCFVEKIDDAGIYVGSSTNYTVRYNRVENCVAGIEIENSVNAAVHNNYTANNTGGLLVFMLTSPPLQLSEQHEVFYNVVVNNNTPNFGDPGSTVGNVPDGTGFLIISNDDGEFHHNYVAGNGSFGFGVIDQGSANALAGTNLFDPLSVGQESVGQSFHHNTITGNGLLLDPDLVGVLPPNLAVIMFLTDDSGGNHNNCFSSNSSAGVELFLTANDCTP